MLKNHRQLLGRFFLTLAVIVLAAVTGLQAAERVELQRDGLTHVAHLEMAPGRSMDDGVILMLHGTMAHGRMEIMETLQGLLAERGYNSLSINLSLGIDAREGMMDCAADHVHRHEDALAELNAWMGWLRDQGAGRVALLAHSRGGAQMAWYVAEYAPEGVEKMVLVAPATHDHAQIARAYESNYGVPLSGVHGEAERLLNEGRPDTLIEDIGFLYCPDARASAAAVASYYADNPNFDTPTLLSKVDLEVLVIAGSEDTTVADLPERMEPLKGKAHIHYDVVDGADHFFRDFFADDAADLAADFIGW
ncbi:alpha/beta hydrolase [Thioalkalivibrio denitrificans]|uniref:Alpha/beta hydrolase n=2 Tax=Thioalkalivibrio denitrificans TaxID=108003 RepID=A0A1V3NHK4_9GAMM|nr:alpha/beta hydrolase [Thioalkalivibrio denitrificans]